MSDDDLSLTPVPHDPFADAINYANSLPPAPPQGTQTLQAYNPSWSERLGGWAQDAMSGLGASRGYSQEFGQKVQTVAGNVPIVGNALSGNSALRDYDAGNYVGAGLNTLGAIPLVGNPLEKAGVTAVKGAIDDAAANAGKGIIAYHGSPYSFDQFDLSKIGTGEGAQAYGHGLYFAGNEDVARGYRDALAKDQYYTSDGQMFDPQTQLQHMNVRVAARNNGSDLDATIARANEILPKASDQTKPMLEHDIAVLQSFKDAGGVSKNPGSMYQVNIAANPDHFLDWDKPLSEQHPVVQDAVNRVARSPEPYGLDKIVSDTLPVEMKNMVMSPDGIQALSKAGVPGIKYLDAGSRGAGAGSRNYVVFDDKTINILKKYGIAGLGIGAGGAAVLGQDQPASATTLTPVQGNPFEVP